MREGVSDDSRANIDLCVSGSVELMGTGDDLMKQTAVNHGVVSAKVVRVVFRSPDSSYVVVNVRTVGRTDLPSEFIAVGEVPGGLAEGSLVELIGYWEESQKFGRRYRIAASRHQDPTTLNGVRALLGSGVIEGIGPTLANRIVERFGSASLEVLASAPERLLEVEGIRQESIERVIASWRSYRDLGPELAILCGYGLTASLAVKVLRQFQSESCEIIRANPYKLMELHGIGFLRADAIAERVGVVGMDPVRVKAAIVFVLDDARHQGHTCFPHDKLVKAAGTLLGTTPDAIETTLLEMGKRRELVEDQGVWYLPQLREAEEVIESSVAVLSRQPLQDCLITSTRTETMALNFLQEQGMRRALTYSVSVVIGAAGVGKTAMVGALVRHAKRLGKTVALCAPTGKAAMRLVEMGAGGAQTLHRLLEYVPGVGCRRHGHRPINADLVVVDEASLLDIELARDLFSALDLEKTAVLLVGDDSQLPSIGAGQVLRDVIESGLCPVTRLEEVQRQAAQSSIIRLANGIRVGKLPSISQDWGENHVWYPLQTVEEIQAKLGEVMASMQEKAGISMASCQVLVPYRRGPLGTERLNRVLQAMAAPLPCPTLGPFRLGDRVMHLINDYQRDVFNGDVGRVCDVNPDEQYMVVEFGDRKLAFLVSQLDRLELAYCITIHKAQGSEFPCVIVILHTSHYVGLRSELLYSAVTRAKRHLVLMGSPQAFHIAAKKRDTMARYSGLFRRPQALSTSS